MRRPGFGWLPCCISICLYWCLLWCSVPTSVAFGGVANKPTKGWIQGSATNYGFNGDGWSIHHGYCFKQYLRHDYCTGWKVAALTDDMPEWVWKKLGLLKWYKDKSLWTGVRKRPCGICLEVRPLNAFVKASNGDVLDRTVSYQPWTCQSHVVMVTDVMSCKYPNPNNKLWACGKRVHIDLSTWVFETFAPTKFGVIGVEFRRVSCKYKPQFGSQEMRFPHPQDKSVYTWKGNRWYQTYKDPRISLGCNKWGGPRPKPVPASKCRAPTPCPKGKEKVTPGFTCAQQASFQKGRKCGDPSLRLFGFCTKTCKNWPCAKNFTKWPLPKRDPK